MTQACSVPKRISGCRPLYLHESGGHGGPPPPFSEQSHAATAQPAVRLLPAWPGALQKASKDRLPVAGQLAIRPAAPAGSQGPRHLPGPRCFPGPRCCRRARSLRCLVPLRCLYRLCPRLTVRHRRERTRRAATVGWPANGPAAGQGRAAALKSFPRVGYLYFSSQRRPTPDQRSHRRPSDCLPSPDQR